MRTFLFSLVFGSIFLSSAAAPTTERILTPRLHHLRHGAKPEWDDFPKKAEGPKLVLRFQAEGNKDEQTLMLRQQDVRQTWRVILNGKELGRLPPDENDMVIVLPVPPGRLLAGENSLAIEQVGKVVDDIRVGQIRFVLALVLARRCCRIQRQSDNSEDVIGMQMETEWL